MQYLTAEEVARINISFVGEGKLLDAGLLSSAVGRPQATFGGEDAYATLFEKVAALFESLVLNHAFLDGNKRTAVVAAIHMLNWNGYYLSAPQEDVINLAIGIVERTMDLAKSTEFFEEHAVRLHYREF
jgi:death-on-curing protein